MFYEALKNGNARNEQFITINVIAKGLIAVFIKGCFRILVKKYCYIDIIKDLKQSIHTHVYTLEMHLRGPYIIISLNSNNKRIHWGKKAIRK